MKQQRSKSWKMAKALGATDLGRREREKEREKERKEEAKSVRKLERERKKD